MSTISNKFCELKTLKNEASVEACFVNALISDLGYKGDDIAYKTSVSELAVGKGSKKVLYKPDYVLRIDGIPAIVVDAKAPSEKLDEWELQCSSYCLEINKFYDYNPVQYFVLTNGISLSLYRWDSKAALLTLAFENFKDDDPTYKELLQKLSRKTIKKEANKLREDIDNEPFRFEAISHSELNNRFQKLHKFIWKAEKKSPSAAFVELMKIVFVKIKKDRQIHESLGSNPKPKYRDVIFSSHWISSQTEQESPINDPLFKNLVNDLEAEIAKRKKKRIFDHGEQINLSSETIKKVVKEIENIDLIAMEEDIHGRMFESFLDATIRGKDIGQFFTPRDIVDLMVSLSDIKVTKQYIDSVLDACCGSAGFLISALGSMLRKVDSLKGLTNKEKDELTNKILNRSIYGIDAGSDPAMYKIARMNMYLHGDGGSNIYYADSLDKGIGKIGRASIEVDAQLEELRKLLLKDGKKFDVILSNPPFSMEYTRDDNQQAVILNQYSISIDRSGGKILNKLLSSVMFLERYRDLVSADGRILAIIDDSVLSGESYKHIREYIRNNFIIIGIISLPGDAFRRASARVKTSIIVLRLRSEEEAQFDLFMTSAIYLGLEEKTAKRIGINPGTLAEQKKKEVERIVSEFRHYESGKAGYFVIPAKNISDRLDVKYCINDRGRKKPVWKKLGLAIVKIGTKLLPQCDRAVQVEKDSEYQLLRVTYDGDIIEGDLADGDSCSYDNLYEVKTWDVLVSNIGVGRGALGIVPPFHDGKYVSNEYTILRAASNEEAVYYTNLLRTKEILADILSSTTGMNRGRIKWKDIEGVEVPEYNASNKEIAALVTEMKDFWSAYQTFANSAQKHTEKVTDTLKVNDEDARIRWLSFKPPE